MKEVWPKKVNYVSERKNCSGYKKLLVFVVKFSLGECQAFYFAFLLNHLSMLKKKHKVLDDFQEVYIRSQYMRWWTRSLNQRRKLREQPRLKFSFEKYFGKQELLQF